MLRLIRRLISSHRERILYLDELDKFFVASDWMRSVQQECMALIDRARPVLRTGSGKNKFDWNGSSSWAQELGQHFHYEESTILGFGMAGEIDLSEKLAHQKQIPDEILFRFPHLIELRGLSADEFEQRIGRA